MIKVPFHRRILPWVFVIAFIFMAPALVFYTAGYRWNSKKGVIERNGTFIIDSKPRDADIEINGKRISDKSPVTLQNTAPGTYTLKLSKQGYHDWSKVLSIEPERVTFATDIYMWPDEQPRILVNGDFDNIYTDPGYKHIIVTSKNSPTSTKIMTYDAKKNILMDFSPAMTSLDITNIHWDDAGDEALLYTKNNILDSINFNQETISTLPEGVYHFEQGQLVGNTNDFLIKFDNKGSLTRENKNQSIIDSFGDYRIMEISGSKGPVFMENADADQGFVLPGGNWQFYDVQKNYLMLKDANRWLWLQIEKEPYSYVMAYADYLYPITIKRQTFYLLHNNNEILTWLPNEEPDLIYRQSEPIIATAWHPDAMDIMMATTNEISMIQLDDRSGRYKTVLANFDNIIDAVIYENQILVTGTKDGQRGLWSIALEKESNSISPLGLIK